MLNLSRFAEEIILWNNPLLGFVELDDSFTTGSSIMPQKKNPDIAELIRAKSGKITGNFVGLLTVLKGLPLTYNRDMQDDKIYLFDTLDTLNLVLTCFAKMLKKTKFNKKACANALAKGFLNATEVADYLVRKNIPFRTAHEITGKIVLHAIAEEKALEELSLKEFQTFCGKIEEDIFKSLEYENCVNKKDVFGGTAIKRVKEQLRLINVK
jgi:argininosuccinate lyase